MKDNKHCYNCEYYKPYYTKGYKQFDKTDLGLCVKTKDTVEKQYACDKFTFCHYIRVGKKDAALAALTENINILVELKQILEEDRDEIIDGFANNLKKELKK